MNDFGHGNTKWFTADRFGMFIHWGLYAMAARHEWVQNNEEIAEEDYRKYFELFEPDLFDPKSWAVAAKNAGMKYVVITAKHHEGFCLFDSQYTEFKATNTKCGKDLLREVLEAFRGEGLRVGVYYSLLDWHHKDFVIDNRIGPYRNLPESERSAMNQGRDMKKYAEYMRNQVTELLTNYGRIDVIWFDFSYPCAEAPEDATRGKGHLQWESEKMIRLVRQLQPEIIVSNRLDLPGAGDIATPEQYTPTQIPRDEAGTPITWEGCQTFSGSWGYHRDESSWKSAGQCIRLLIDHVSRNGNLLMNVGPTARGFLDERALARLDDYAKWMKYHQKSIYNCAAAEGFQAPADCRYTLNSNTKRLYLHIYAWPFVRLQLAGLADKIKYAQFLHDGSEIKWIVVQKSNNSMSESTPDGAITLLLPVIKPNVEVPVVEFFLK